MTDCKWKVGDRVFVRLHVEQMQSAQTRPARILRMFEAKGAWYAWVRVATLPPEGLSPEPRKWIIGDLTWPVAVELLSERSGSAIPGLDEEEEGEPVPVA